MKKRKKGFTLIELMIVVAIIGILAAIASSKFGDLINKSKEGATKGGLSVVRSSLQIYYGDNEGIFPSDILSILTEDGKYINEIPKAKLPGTGFANSNAIITYSSFTVSGEFSNVGAGDSSKVGGWAYANDSGVNNNWGNFLVNCTEDDVSGIPWTNY